MSFQTTVNTLQAPAVNGDFASQNPRANVLAAAGQLVAPASGLSVGKFCFVNPADGTVHAAYTSGYQIGFLARNAQGLITAFLAESSMVVPQGFMVTLFDSGEFYAAFPVAAPTPGVPVYAAMADGTPQVSSTGGVLTGFLLRSAALAGELAIISSFGV